MALVADSRGVHAVVDAANPPILRRVLSWPLMRTAYRKSHDPDQRRLITSRIVGRVDDVAHHQACRQRPWHEPCSSGDKTTSSRTPAGEKRENENLNRSITNIGFPNYSLPEVAS